MNTHEAWNNWDLKLPRPPGRHFGQAGHHWLKLDINNADGSKKVDHVPTEYCVMQWSPTRFTWVESNTLSTMREKPRNMEGWVWLAHVPLPDELIPSS